MADVARDRGQLILVTGLAVAVTLVALVLLLNTVIYTQNLATRGPTVEEGDAVSFRQEAVDGVGGVLDAENREEYDSRSKVEENVTDGVSRFDELLSRYHAESATIVRIEEETLALTDGFLLRQTDASRDFTNVDGSATDWLLADGVANARRVRLTVSGEDLTEGRSGSFQFELDDGSAAWTVFLYNDTAGNDIVVAVENETDASPNVACRTSGPEATVDLTRGTLNGSACPELAWATGVDAPYSVSFRNGDQATGTYELTVDAPESQVEKTNFAGPGDADSPRWAYAAYAAEFEIHYQTRDLVFHTALRVAPGEPS